MNRIDGLSAHFWSAAEFARDNIGSIGVALGVIIVAGTGYLAVNPSSRTYLYSMIGVMGDFSHGRMNTVSTNDPTAPLVDARGRKIRIRILDDATRTERSCKCCCCCC